jgi:hypothetical protein
MIAATSADCSAKRDTNSDAKRDIADYQANSSAKAKASADAFSQAAA